MVRRTVRDLHSEEKIPARFCDVIVDEDKIYLEIKKNNSYLKIYWPDVVVQVESAINESK